MNSFLTHLVRRDHTVQLAAHLVAGIVSLLLLSGFARPEPASNPVVEIRAAAPALVVASALNH